MQKIFIIVLVAIFSSNFLTAQVANPDSTKFNFNHRKSTCVGFNPVHLFFGHLTGSVEFFGKKHPHASTRWVFSAGISESKKRYNFITGFDQKAFAGTNYSRSSGFIGIGCLGGHVESTAFRTPAVWVVAPRVSTGLQFQTARHANFTLEVTAGVPVYINGPEFDSSKPFEFTFGFIIGGRS